MLNVKLENIRCLRCYDINVGFIVFNVPGVGCAAMFRQVVVVTLFFFIVEVSA